MWLEHRFDLFLTVLIFSDFIRTVICLTGDNICLEQERYVAAVRKPFKKPVHVREYKWCLQIPPRCEEDKIIYVDDYKTEDEERIRIIEKCCTGYKENTEAKTCDPISCSHCVHATCNATIGKCLCDDGYIGENCDTQIPSTVQTPFSVSPTTENNSYETSTLINENIKLNSEIFISKNISIKIFSTPAPENKNITNEWPNMKYNQKNLDDSDIIPILREIFPRSTTQKIETTTKSFGSNDDTTFVYSNQTDVFDYETYEEVSTNKSVQTTEYSIKDEKPMKYNNLTDVIMKIYNDDEVIKDLERNNDLLRRVHDAIVKDSMNNNQTLLINQSNTQTIYHTVMITLLGIAIGIFLAIIIASIILYMTDTSRKVAKHTRARLQNTVMNKKDYVPNSVHYIQRDEFMTPLQERITIFNPKFTAEPESTFGNLLTTDCRDKVNRFITDTLRVVYDNTYDHPQSPPTNGQFVGSTFFASKSDQSAEHLYDEIPAWKQPKPIAQAQLPQYSETCEYVTKSDGPDIITTKL